MSTSNTRKTLIDLPERESDIQDYLDQYFLSKRMLASELDIEIEEVAELTEIGFIPSCSYKVENKIIYSYVFGRSRANDCRDDEYFSPSVISWFKSNSQAYSLNAKDNHAMAERIRSDFIAKYIEIATHNSHFFNIFRNLNKNDLLEMAERTWSHHTKGTYGICVRTPSSIEQIISKQVIVEELIQLTQDGQRRNFSKEEWNTFKISAKKFDQIAMPFSPADYEKSSRKRLVDNVFCSVNLMDKFGT